MTKSESKGFNIPRLVTILMTASLLAGIATGWFVAGYVPEYGRLLNGLGVHINIINDMKISALEYFVERSLKYAIPLAAVWFLAFLPPAAAIAPFFVFYKGIGTGLATRALVDLSGIDGIKQAAVLYFPQNLLLIPARCFIAADSINQALGSIRARMIMNDKTSLFSAGISLKGSKRGGKPGYGGKLLTALICALAAAAWETWITPMLLKNIR